MKPALFTLPSNKPIATFCDNWGRLMLSFPRALRACVLLLTLGLVAAPVWAQRLRAPINSAQRVPLRGQVPAQASPANDDGVAEAGLVLPGISLVLQPSREQEAELEKLLAEQQDPASPNYHKWLTPEEYGERFGAGVDDIARISEWLEQQNLNVVSVARARNSIQARGTALAVDRAFSTEIHRYTASGRRHFSNATDPQIPADLNGMVAAIHGLNDFSLEPRSHQVNTDATAGPRYTSGRGITSLSPGDFAVIYNVKPLHAMGLDGTGQSIAVAGQTALEFTDVRSFRATFGLLPSDPERILVPGFADPGYRANDAHEANLDLQWAGALAPNARIRYVYSNLVMDAVHYAIDQNLAPIISVSYGVCELSTSNASMRALQSWARQGNAQGITWVNASGDSGGADCMRGSTGIGALAVDTPASVPEVTGIGGTTLTATGPPYWSFTNDPNGVSALSYMPERVWNDSRPGDPAAGGGGASIFFTKPSWQAGPGVLNDGMRSVPDISFAASPNLNGYIAFNAGSMNVYGGTSAGAPAFSGILALLNQYLGRTGQSPGVGNVNARLYSLVQSAPEAFHDITVGDNIVTITCEGRTSNCTPGSYGYPAAPGYDMASGLGSIDAYQLVMGWNRAANGRMLSQTPVGGTVLSRSTRRVRDTVTVNPTASVVEQFKALGVEALAVEAKEEIAEPAAVSGAVGVPGSAPLVSGSPGQILTLLIHLGEATAQQLSVTVGGVSAPVISVGSAPAQPELAQVNYQVPASVPIGSQPVVVHVGSTASSPAYLNVVR